MRRPVCAHSCTCTALSPCVCACLCVTGVQRGPARGTEFKFQIWSVSQGVTVCIALPAGSNSLHRWCVFVPSPPTLARCPRHGLSSSPCPFTPSPPGTHPMVPLTPTIYLSISIFHIIQTREESDLIERRERSPLKGARIKTLYRVFYVRRGN